MTIWHLNTQIQFCIVVFVVVIVVTSNDSSGLFYGDELKVIVHIEYKCVRMNQNYRFSFVWNERTNFEKCHQQTKTFSKLKQNTKGEHSAFYLLVLSIPEAQVIFFSNIQAGFTFSFSLFLTIQNKKTQFLQWIPWIESFGLFYLSIFHFHFIRISNNNGYYVVLISILSGFLLFFVCAGTNGTVHWYLNVYRRKLVLLENVKWNKLIKAYKDEWNGGNAVGKESRQLPPLKPSLCGFIGK